jgi:hypothetical protein
VLCSGRHSTVPVDVVYNVLFCEVCDHALSSPTSGASSTVSWWTSLPRRPVASRMYATMFDGTSLWTSMKTMLETRAQSLRMSSLTRHQQHANVRRDVPAHVWSTPSQMTSETLRTSRETSHVPFVASNAITDVSRDTLCDVCQRISDVSARDIVLCSRRHSTIPADIVYNILFCDVCDRALLSPLSATSSTVSHWTYASEKYAEMFDETFLWTSMKTMLVTRALSLWMSSLTRH